MLYFQFIHCGHISCHECYETIVCKTTLPPTAKVQVTVHKGNKNSTITDLNTHLNAKPNILSPNLMESYWQKGLLYLVFFEQLPQITLSSNQFC